MTDVKRLLEQATPLPWELSDFVADADDALIVYAVNHLPDYLAAVEALEAVLPWVAPPTGGMTYDAFERTRAVLARLREGEAANVR